MKEGGPLFWDHNINDVFRHQLDQMRKDGGSISDPVLKVSPRETLVADFFERFRLDAPVLKEQEIYTTKDDARVDVSQDVRRMIRDRSQPFYKDGTTFRLHVPFVGDKQFFKFQPTSFSMNPQVGLIHDAEVVCTYTAVEPGAEQVKAHFDSWLAGVKTNLDTLNGNCQKFNADLPDEVQQAIGQRYVRLHRDEEVLGGLGYPTKKPSPAPETAGPGPVRVGSDKYDAFICHASEDKEAFVRPLASKLQEVGFRIWYDEFELTVGDSLRQSIDKGLAKSRFGIVVLSQTFVGKDWTQYELNGLAAKEIGANKVILPIWHGISRNEVLAYSPNLADKVGLDSNMGIEQLVAKLSQVLNASRPL